jgi:hypothetical protein
LVYFGTSGRSIGLTRGDALVSWFRGYFQALFHSS